MRVFFYLVNINRLPCLVVNDVAVALAVDGAFVEGHDVLRQGTGLVTVDMKWMLESSRHSIDLVMFKSI